jgi:hypothetical protein
MSKETEHTTPVSDSQPLRATRRAALRGAGLAGLLALGGSATASQHSPEANAQQTNQSPSADDESVPVT